MQLREDLQLKTAIRALTEVVLPAVDATTHWPSNRLRWSSACCN